MSSSSTSRESDLPISIYLARHGQTELNATGALRGHLDPTLDGVGQREAKGLAMALASFRPGLVVSSPLRRAVETARFIADECGIDVEVDELLIDRDYGQWAGRPLEEVVREFGSVDAAPGVEPRDAVVTRATLALETVADRAEDGAVIVAHDAVNRLLISALDPHHFNVVEQIPQRTACFNLLQRVDGNWTVARVDVRPGREADGFAKR